MAKPNFYVDEKERAIWAATYGAAWANDFFEELSNRYAMGQTEGVFDTTLENDHAERAIYLANEAVEQYRKHRDGKF